MLKNVPITLSGTVMTSLETLSFSTLGGYNNSVGSMGRQYFLHNKL